MSDFLIRYDTISPSDELDHSTALKIFTFEPPNKTERGKEKIRLMIAILLKGNKQIDQTKLINLGNSLAGKFYQSNGPVTSALKGIIDQFNAELFDANMSTTSKGVFQNGHIVVLALRESVLYIVQSGLSKVFHITQLNRTFNEPALAGKGAGLSSQARMYFAQAQVDDNDKFIIAFNPDEKVEKGIESLRQISSFDVIQHRLTMISQTPIHGAILHFQNALNPEFVPVIGPELQKSEEYQTPEIAADNHEVPDLLLGGQQIISGSSEVVENRTVDARKPRHPRQENISNPAAFLLGGLLKIKHGIQALRRLSPVVVDHLSPNPDLTKANKGYRNLSIGAAILLPIFLLLYANFYYGTYGYVARYNSHLDNAEKLLAIGTGVDDPAGKKQSFYQALDEIALAKASVSKLDERGAQILSAVQLPLDELEMISRLEYTPALSQRLPSDHTIQQIAVTDSEIYLLDETENKVNRYVFNGTRYDQDKGFVCGGSAITTDESPGKILAVMPLTRGLNQSNTIVAIDQNARMIYCGPGRSQQVEPLLLPSRGIKSVTKAAIQGGTMLLLDAAGRAVWVYQADENSMFTQIPEFYFSGDIQFALSEIVDMAYNGGNLYLINSRGELTRCSNNQAGIVTCESPFIFTDPREGMQSGSVLLDGHFNRLLANRLPIDSVLFLDQSQKAIFRFNALTMELQSKYLANINSLDETLIENEFRAFALNESNRVFILVRDQVYTAELFD